MLKRFLKVIEKFVLSAILIYAYDSFNIFSSGIIPINFFTILIVTFFGVPGLLCLILFSFLI